ncbi:MAG: cell division protein ZapB [Gemmatimonadetes bacterium]|nr:MAG: cell division protein ZapB [Gemmatimonadota bacterium]
MEIPSLKTLEDKIAQATKLIVQLRHENKILREENQKLRGKTSTSPAETPPDTGATTTAEEEALKQDSEKIRLKVEQMLSKFEELEL